MTKICTKCKESKDVSDFYVVKGLPRPQCKRCVCVAVQLASRKPRRHFRILYKKLCERVKTRERYAKLGQSVTWEGFQSLYDQHMALYPAWVASGYALSLSPSVDRIDNDLGYHIDNMRIVTQSENVARHKRGESNIFAKITAGEVLRIRQTYEEEDISQTDLAKRYGIKLSQAHDIVRRKTWKHI